MGTAIASTRRLSMRQSNGRVANAVADLLRRKLSVPEIYLQPRLPGLAGVDVLAVNHAGSGDIHGVEIAFGSDLGESEQVDSVVERLKRLPLHFKYLAVPIPIASAPVVRDTLAGIDSFSEDGLGRIGLIAYPVGLLDAEIASERQAATLLIAPERFVLRGEQLTAVEHFLETSVPDIRVRI